MAPFTCVDLDRDLPGLVHFSDLATLQRLRFVLDWHSRHLNSRDPSVGLSRQGLPAQVSLHSAAALQLLAPKRRKLQSKV